MNKILDKVNATLQITWNIMQMQIVNPLLSPPPPPPAGGGLFLFQTHLRERGLFNLAKTIVFIKNLSCAKKKGLRQEVGGHAAEDQKQIWNSSWWIKHPRSVQMECYICNWLKQSTACKVSSRFCCRASDVCSLLARWASAVFLGNPNCRIVINPANQKGFSG